MAAKKKSKGRSGTGKKPMLFSGLNYKLMGLGVIFVITGFTAMYLENEVRGFISLYISPILILGGYITIIFAILKRDKESVEPQSTT